jgi:PAS domain S-box-containing protein
MKALLLPAVSGGALGFLLFRWHERNRRFKERLTHLNSVLRSIRDINKILTREKDTGVLIQEICDTLVENRDYFSAWIALTDHHGNYNQFAETAVGDDFKSVRDIFKKGGTLSCCQRVLSQGEVVVTDAPTTLCGGCPLAFQYENRGAYSAMLSYNGRNYGMITLSTPESLLFDQEEVRLVSELSNDISFGLYTIELDKQRRLSEQALNENVHNLKERMKELNCLYSLSEIIARPNQTTDDIMRHAVGLIPLAFQYPEAVCTRIKIKNRTYKTDNFEESDQKIERDIVVNQKVIGKIAVCCLKGEVTLAGDPFLAEEKALVGAVAERLAKTIERIQAQRDLKESEERFRILVENSLTGISIVQGDEVVYQNTAQEQMLGPLPREPIMGDYRNVHPDDISKVRQFSKTVMEGDFRSNDLDFRYSPAKDKAGLIWIHCRANRVVYRKKRSILFNMMDMTRPKELEKLLLVQDKMASLGRIAAGIAHEIRNPLSGINIYLNTLEKFFERGESEKKVKSVFSQLQSASGKIESVIRRVMDFSKPSEPIFVLDDVNGPINEALKLTATTLRKSGVLLEIDLGKDLPKCRMDPQQLEEVIINVINNAADSMRHITDGKRIKIISAEHEHYLLIRVLDSGPGISPENREKIFDPFFTTKSDSTGIGLSICHRILSDHGGRIKAQTNEWGGTEFRILIPTANSVE